MRISDCWGCSACGVPRPPCSPNSLRWYAMYFPIDDPADGPSTDIKEVVGSEKWPKLSLVSENAQLLNPPACLIRDSGPKVSYVCTRAWESEGIRRTGKNSSRQRWYLSMTT